jgi:hypothetical protein
LCRKHTSRSVSFILRADVHCVGCKVRSVECCKGVFPVGWSDVETSFCLFY